MSDKKKIALLSGSFDPVHTGYLQEAHSLLERGFDEVWLLPAKEGVLDSAERIHLCRVLCEDEPAIRPCKAMIKHGDKAEKHLKKQHEDAGFTLFSSPEQDEKCAQIRRSIKNFDDPDGMTEALLRQIAVGHLYLPDYMSELKKMISEKRLRHTLGVRDTAVEMALRWHAPVIRCAVAGLLHDCAKGMPEDKLFRLAAECGLMSEDTGMHSYPVLHGPVGAHLAKEKFGVKDREILNAIIYHTVGRPGMTNTELIVFVADAIEPNRENYPTLQAIREAAGSNLNRAAYISIRGTYDYLSASGKPFDPASLATLQFLKARLEQEENEYNNENI